MRRCKRLRVNSFRALVQVVPLRAVGRRDLGGPGISSLWIIDLDKLRHCLTREELMYHTINDYSHRVEQFDPLTDSDRPTNSNGATGPNHRAVAVRVDPGYCTAGNDLSGIPALSDRSTIARNKPCCGRRFYVASMARADGVAGESVPGESWRTEGCSRCHPPENAVALLNIGEQLTPTDPVLKNLITTL